MKEKIQEVCKELQDEYQEKLNQWYKENPGSIMNGLTMMIDSVKKASFCENITEVESFYTCYDVCIRSFKGNEPHGFLFSRNAIEELLKRLKNGK